MDMATNLSRDSLKIYSKRFSSVLLFYTRYHISLIQYLQLIHYIHLGFTFILHETYNDIFKDFCLFAVKF